MIQQGETAKTSLGINAGKATRTILIIGAGYALFHAYADMVLMNADTYVGLYHGLVMALCGVVPGIVVAGALSKDTGPRRVLAAAGWAVGFPLALWSAAMAPGAVYHNPMITASIGRFLGDPIEVARAQFGLSEAEVQVGHLARTLGPGDVCVGVLTVPPAVLVQSRLPPGKERFVSASMDGDRPLPVGWIEAERVCKTGAHVVVEWSP